MHHRIYREEEFGVVDTLLGLSLMITASPSTSITVKQVVQNVGKGQAALHRALKKGNKEVLPFKHSSERRDACFKMGPVGGDQARTLIPMKGNAHQCHLNSVSPELSSLGNGPLGLGRASRNLEIKRRVLEFERL